MSHTWAELPNPLTRRVTPRSRVVGHYALLCTVRHQPMDFSRGTT